MDHLGQELREQFETSTGNYFTDRLEHTRVTVQLIYWQDNDFEPKAALAELDGLRNVFSCEYHYDVLPDFRIPSRDAQMETVAYVSGLIVSHAAQPNTLLIVYYAGHCFHSRTDDESVWADDDEFIWAAANDRRNDPTLSWTPIGQALYGAPADVLVILDCCDGAMKLKGIKRQGRFELLAASAFRVSTPVPGWLSFTSFLVRELKKRKSQGITAAQLASMLWNQPHITVTPHHDDFARKNLPSVPLRPLKQTNNLDNEKTQQSLTVISVLSKDVSGYDLAAWLKANAPKSVTAVSIEAALVRANDLLKDARLNDPKGDTILGRLPDEALQVITRQREQLNLVVRGSMISSQTADQYIAGQVAVEQLDCINHAANAVQSAVETSLLLDLDEEELDRALSETNLVPNDTSEMVTLRNAVFDTGAVYDDLERLREDIIISCGANEEYFCICYLNNQTVLIEWLSYEPDEEPTPELTQRVKQLTRLLHLKKRKEFRTMLCRGFVHDKLNTRFGLIFEPEIHYNTSSTPVSLQAYYNVDRFFPLGDRFKLAYNLAVAVDHFHRVGWVHKALSSSTIFFLKTNQDKIDVSSPWIFGFRSARTENAATALDEDHNTANNHYRHPQRIGKPQQRFQKFHDVYSLGIILFEIARCAEVSELIKRHDTIKATTVRDKVLQYCEQKLPFVVGKTYTNAISTCIKFETLTVGMSEAKAQSFFQQNVVESLRKASWGV